jgi:hypothetical protein
MANTERINYYGHTKSNEQHWFYACFIGIIRLRVTQPIALPVFCNLKHKSSVCTPKWYIILLACCDWITHKGLCSKHSSWFGSIYAKYCTGVSRVQYWTKHFKDGNRDITNLPHSSRPRTPLQYAMRRKLMHWIQKTKEWWLGKS